MATNAKQVGKTIRYTNSTGSAISSGDLVYLAAALVGVAVTDIANGESGAVCVEGVYELAKDSSESIAQGAALYWDDVNSRVTAKPSQYFVGKAWEADSSTAVIDVKLNDGAALGSYGKGKVTLDATSGLAVGTHELGAYLPNGARLIRTWYEVETTFTDGASDAATIALGIETDDAAGIKAATAISAGGNVWDAGFHEGIQTGTMANISEQVTTATRQLIATVGVAALTDGKLHLHYEWAITAS